MSIDLVYFSFNEQRAEAGWKNFSEDIKALREATFEPYKLQKKRNFEHRKIIELVNPIFDERRHQKRLEVFKSFSDRNYFLPGTTSWEYSGEIHPSPSIHECTITEYEKSAMEYLLTYGTVYPGGIKDGINWQMLDRASANEYQQIEDDKQLEIEKREKQNPVFSHNLNKIEVVLTNRQILLKRNCSLNNLLYSDSPYTDLQFEMSMVDLYYGSVMNDSFEDNSAAMAIMEYCNHSGDKLKNLYNGSIKENVFMLSNVLAGEYGWDKEDSIFFVMDVLKSMKPVAKDLKENPESFLVLSFGGVDRFEPVNAHDFLFVRAKKNIEKYKGILPPIL